MHRNTLSEIDCLVIWLVLHRLDTASAWKPYLSSLPEDFNTIPAVMQAKDVLHVFPNQLSQRILKQKETMRESFIAIQKMVVDIKGSVEVTEQLHQWAWLAGT